MDHDACLSYHKYQYKRKSVMAFSSFCYEVAEKGYQLPAAMFAGESNNSKCQQHVQKKRSRYVFFSNEGAKQRRINAYLLHRPTPLGAKLKQNPPPVRTSIGNDENASPEDSPQRQSMDGS